MSFTISRVCSNSMSIESVMPSHHLILCCALLLLPSICPTNRVLPQLTKVVELQLQHQSPSSDYPGLICFRIDSFDLFAVQGTLKSSPEPQLKRINSLALNLFIVQFSRQDRITGKTIALTVCSFAGKVMSLLFNVLCSFVIAFLPRNKHL